MSKRKLHWQPKDTKANAAQDVREFVQRSDPHAKMESLDRMTTADLTALMLALQQFEPDLPDPEK